MSDTIKQAELDKLRNDGWSFPISGKSGSGFTILGYYDTIDSLRAAVTSPEPGNAYGVGTMVPYSVYVWDSVSGNWKDNGTIIQGPEGPKGKDGQDGFSPTATVTKEGSVSTLTVTDKNGTTSVKILDGVGGEGGEGGTEYTPVKGVDYWTDEDKAEIKQYIDTELLGGES